MMMILASISEGHTDLADLCFLLAFILLAVAFVVEIVNRPMNIIRDCGIAAAALIALGFFVL
jgi:hypothetical protein